MVSVLLFLELRELAVHVESLFVPGGLYVVVVLVVIIMDVVETSFVATWPMIGPVGGIRDHSVASNSNAHAIVEFFFPHNPSRLPLWSYTKKPLPHNK